MKFNRKISTKLCELQDKKCMSSVVILEGIANSEDPDQAAPGSALVAKNICPNI